MSRRAIALAGLGIALCLACRGEPVGAQRDAGLARLVDSLKPAVERAAGLRFKRVPASALRSREQVHAYLVAKLRQELPPERMRGIETAYRLLGLLPDTLHLERLLLDLYSEQVAGFYDPDSTMLFGVADADPVQMRLVLAHEMVHALQGQYLPLDSILHDIRSNDRLAAAQAVLEGHATLVSIRVLSPGFDVTTQPGFWDTYREQASAQQASMPVFSGAPLLVRETLLFPYLDGAEFMQWWEHSPYKDALPAGPHMPASTEQILHPDRLLSHDQPIPLRFKSGPPRTYADGLGEIEIRVLEAQLRGEADLPATVVPLGWGNDLYAVYDSPAGPALVWWAVWDDARSADRFAAGTGRLLAARSRPGYRSRFDRLQLDGRPASRFVIAPAGWALWNAVPDVTTAP
ncbi:MAG TPA: hypothetical protein VK688_00885 [Gemmatimonadales bacterium]|nr:hypothetical protein [Gemmatimonadales bacterium]